MSLHVCKYFFTFSVSLQERTFSTLEFYRELQDKLTPASLHMFQSDWDESVRDTFWHTLGEDGCSISFINFLCCLVLVSCIKQNVTQRTISWDKWMHSVIFFFLFSIFYWEKCMEINLVFELISYSKRQRKGDYCDIFS